MIKRWQDPSSVPLSRNAVFALALVLAFLYLSWRNIGLYPMVFADEWLYSSAARLLPFRESTLPSYLFLGLFSLTNACGSGFLDCARVLNALLFTGAAPFIYLIARRVCPPKVAMLLALLSVLAPVSSFTAYFMPEAAYFFVFFVFAWVTLENRHLSPPLYGLATGAVLGLATTVKIHAMFLLPALLAFMLFLCWSERRERRWPLAALQMGGTAILSVLLVKVAVGTAFAGSAGLNFFGNFYGAHASGSASSIGALLKLLPAAQVSLQGHVMALALLAGLPLAACALYLLDGRARAAGNERLTAIVVFALLMLGATLGLTVMFTASIANMGAAEGTRLHLRYYDFLFPLLFIIAAAPLCAAEQASSRPWRVALALVFALGAVYSAKYLPLTYSSVLTDGPELAALIAFPRSLAIHTCLMLLVLLVWVFHRRAASQLFVFVLLPVTLFNADGHVRKIQAGSRLPGPYDKAGTIAHLYLSKEEASKLTVLGEGAGLLRTLFHIDTPGARFQELAPGAPLALEELSPRHDWLLVVGQHALPEELVPVIRTADFALIKATRPHHPIARVSMAAPLAGGVIGAAEGFSSFEPWGAWTVGKQARLVFAQPLPKALTIVISANALPPKAGQLFTISVGKQQRNFRLAGTPQDRFFQFTTDGEQRTITIDIPDPASPRSVGFGDDDRLLGLALNSIEIGTSSAP